MSSQLFPPEQAWALAEYLHTSCAGNWKGDIHSAIVAWAKQNPIKPLVVGLTNDQITELAFSLLNVNRAANKSIIDAICEYLATQSFNKLEEVSASDYNRLVDDYIELGSIYSEQQKYLEQLKSDNVVEIKKRYVPSWDNAPEWANWLGQSSSGVWTWYEKKPVPSVGLFSPGINETFMQVRVEDWKATLHQRPVSGLNIGSEWKHSTWGFVVTIIGIDNGIDFSFNEDPKMVVHVGDINDFVTKFSLV